MLRTDPTVGQTASHERLEHLHGHPGHMWAKLNHRVSEDRIISFQDVQNDWLNLMWSLDAYRTAAICPHDMGKKSLSEQRRLDAVYRGKGNWFASLCASLLANATDERIGSRTNVQGFSQTHQIDIAWPARTRDVHVCAEAKVAGAPPQPTSGARKARADFASRRKELKFSATDLKLYRRDRETRIDHWGHWRKSANPKTFLLWGARLASEKGESIRDLVREGTALENTYLDGVGLLAWMPDTINSRYESVQITPGSGIRSLDDMLHFISAEITHTARQHGGEPAPIEPPSRAVEED